MRKVHVGHSLSAIAFIYRERIYGFFKEPKRVTWEVMLNTRGAAVAKSHRGLVTILVELILQC
jgi:hypothetical protein